MSVALLTQRDCPKAAVYACMSQPLNALLKARVIDTQAEILKQQSMRGNRGACCALLGFIMHW